MHVFSKASGDRISPELTERLHRLIRTIGLPQSCGRPIGLLRAPQRAFHSTARDPDARIGPCPGSSLHGPTRELITLPWDTPLADWPEENLVALPRGISRHVVRFVRVGSDVYALKEVDGAPRIA